MKIDANELLTKLKQVKGTYKDYPPQWGISKAIEIVENTVNKDDESRPVDLKERFEMECV